MHSIARSTFHLEHHLPFETYQPRMSQIEGDADAGDAVRREPLVTQPCVNTKAPKACAIELFAQAVDAVLEPSVLYGQAELRQANVEKLFGR